MINRGEKFRITKRSHWAYGRVFVCTGTPALTLAGNPDTVPLVWKPGDLVEFEIAKQRYLIPKEWVEPA